MKPEAQGAMQFDFDTASVTHQGRVRKYNEDGIFTDPAAGIWLVADGMGGHKDGNIASGMIVSAAGQLAASNADGALGHRFKDTLHTVNRDLVNLAKGEAGVIVGSTVASLLVHGHVYTCTWAGDSRCYLIRSGAIRQLSRDHTEVQELVDKGMITPVEARTWPRRNVITRAVGAGDDLALETVSGTLEAGDCFVLCSDGLTGHVEDREILNSASWSTSKDACDALLALALERGGKDNISVIVVNVARREQTAVVQR